MGAYFMVNAMMWQYRLSLLSYCHHTMTSGVLACRGAWKLCRSGHFASAKFTRQLDVKKRMVLHGVGEAYFIINANMRHYRANLLGYCHHVMRLQYRANLLEYCHHVMRLKDVLGSTWSMRSIF